MRYEWPRYVPVGERRAKARKDLEKLAKKGLVLQPVRVEGLKIARTFWGKAWCKHLESFSDFENRLPRGRTYVRNGSVCHLEIASGEVKAKVSGSLMYTVTIGIKQLGIGAWKDIKKRCAGEIDSLLDLLGGRLSDGVMAVVTDREDGLFPKPKEITMDCSCPDWAVMCKHVAAVLYGVGARLDERPELLFLLRGVNHEELVSAKVEEAVEAAVRRGGGRRLVESDLSEVFGIDVEAPSPSASRPKSRKGPGPAAASPLPEPGPKQASKRFPPVITGSQVGELRKRLGLSSKDFAHLLGVSGGAVSVWERTRGELNLHERSKKALEKAWRLAAERGRPLSP
jgi:uncharacterized Zn finger protein